MSTHAVTIRDIRALRGPNLHAHMPVLQIVLDIGSYEEQPSSHFPGMVERLLAWLPGLEKHECSLGRPGGFIERLRQGTYLGHICEHITLELQGLMGFDVSFGRARGTGERGVYTVVIAYAEEQSARAAFNTALRLSLAAMHNEPFEMDAELERLRMLADEHRLGPSTSAIVAAARSCHIPVLRLTPSGSLVQLGYGINQKRILASETSETSSIAVALCQEKTLTNRMLRLVGVPVPEGRSVASAEDAWAAVQDIGLPVVVKPEDGNQGKGVSVNLSTEDEVRQAYAIAHPFGELVMVEKFIEGADYRLLVVNGDMVAAARRDPALVVGDGQHTVAQLVALANRDPRRRPGHSSTLTQIVLDDAAQLVLVQQDLSELTIPEAGQVVRLRHNANLSTGGTATDVTDEVHPTNARLAELAAQILALDVAGIDILCWDISRPLAEQDGAIVEVNAAPGLRMYLYPAVGTPRDVGKPIIEMLYPGDSPSRIPVIAVTGTNGKTTVTRLISHMYETAHKVVGMTCTEGTFIAGERILTGDCSGPNSARTVLLHPRVEVAVLETARGGILREGLAFDECSIGLVTNISADHLGLGGIHTLEELARVKQVVIEAVSDNGTAVLNADDPLVAEMAAATGAQVIYFSTRADNPIISAHLAEGGACVYISENTIILATSNVRTELIELDRVSFTMNGRIPFQVSNALAATAAAWGQGLNPAMMARALTTFTTDSETMPGRFNISYVNGVEIILDYGHNAAAIKALGEAVQALEPRPTTMVLGLPGDRRDEDLGATCAATIPFVDNYILYDLEDRRGREPLEVPHLMQSVIPKDKPCQFNINQPAAIQNAWAHIKPGERLIIIADVVDEALDSLRVVTAAAIADAACVTPVHRHGGR